jgi:transposase
MMLYLGRLDNLTRERKMELEKKLRELKEPKLLDSFYQEIYHLGYKESLYLIDDISIKEVLDFGDIAAQHKIFEKLEICEIINKYSTKGGGTIDVGRLAEIMAINRNCDPCSRRKLPAWFETTVLPILLNIKPSEVNDKLFLRTFPYLQEKTTIPIQKEIYDKITQTFGIKTEKIYYDITSSYFEGKSCPLSKYGYNRDEIKNKVQIVMGLVVDQDGILITHTVHPGNTADVKTVDSMNKRLRDTFGIENSILVVDRGMISTKNVKQLDINMQPYVFALKLKNQEKEIIDALRENLKPIDDNTSLAEVILVDNSRRKKYVVGHSKDIEEARKYEGVFILSTTEIDLKGEDILKIYREKDIIEKAFRTIKSEIEMRPFFLSSETSVIGYVFICALAYQIRSVLKFHMKKCNSEMSIEDAFEILNKYKVVKIAVEERGVQVFRKVAIAGQKAIDIINCFDLESEFEKVSCLNSV